MSPSLQANTSDPASAVELQLASHNLRDWTVRWLLFFLICLGLGYASVQRYDPRQIDGLSDAAVYYRMVAGEQVEARELRFRVLVPYLARVFYALTGRFLQPPQSIYLALLIANSIFAAIAACLLIAVALRIGFAIGVGLLAATLFLLNFAVVNLHLAALVDAAELCLLLALTLTLFSDRWWLLPLWGVLGALAKETFVPIAGGSVIGWLVASRPSERSGKVLPVAIMLVMGVVTIILLRAGIAGAIDTSDILVTTHAGAGSFAGRLSVFISPTVWYVFVWLLPLGALRLNRLPRSWIVASCCSSAVVLILSMYRDVGGNAARPLFNTLGPLLCLGAAIWLSESGGHLQPGLSPQQKRANSHR